MFSACFFHEAKTFSRWSFQPLINIYARNSLLLKTFISGICLIYWIWTHRVWFFLVGNIYDHRITINNDQENPEGGGGSENLVHNHLRIHQRLQNFVNALFLISGEINYKPCTTLSTQQISSFYDGWHCRSTASIQFFLTGELQICNYGPDETLSSKHRSDSSNPFKQVMTPPLLNARQEAWMSRVLGEDQDKGLAGVTVDVAH